MTWLYIKENIWYLPFYLLLPYALIMGVLSLLFNKRERSLTEFEKRSEDLEFDKNYYSKKK